MKESIENENDEKSAIPDTEEADISNEEDQKHESYLYGLFESVLFLSNEPLPVTFFVKNFGVDSKTVKIVLDSIVDEFEQRDGGIKVCEISGGYQFTTDRKYAREIRRALLLKKKEGLTRGMLETLSIIAYKQPAILAEIDELRGVSSRMMLANLMKRNLIKPVGRKDLPGRPLLYGTTDEFLRYFGLNNLSDLPDISEIEELSYVDKE